MLFTRYEEPFLMEVLTIKIASNKGNITIFYEYYAFNTEGSSFCDNHMLNAN